LNIFALDYDPKKSARCHVNSHIVKMPLETAQMLCTARHILGSDSEPRYKPSHKNHPCTKWVMESQENYLWLCRFGLELCDEYSWRYWRTHACRKVILDCLDDAPKFDANELTVFALAMPDDCKLADPVDSYRKYYQEYKKHLFKWKDREVPEWIG
jgi:hypothetical protein